MTEQHRPDPAPFAADEIASMRAAADEDRHLARVVATVDALAAQLRAAEEERDEANDRANSEWERFSMEMERGEALIGQLNAERSRREAAEERAGRLEALLREFANPDNWHTYCFPHDGKIRPVWNVHMDDYDHPLFRPFDLAEATLATAAPQPPEPPRTTREALAELVRASEDDGLYDREFAEARRKAAPQPDPGTWTCRRCPTPRALGEACPKCGHVHDGIDYDDYPPGPQPAPGGAEEATGEEGAGG